MVYSLIDFALGVLKLLMFRVCGIIGISKIKFFNFDGTEKVHDLTYFLSIMSKMKLLYTVIHITLLYC